jgi:uncharacterized protein (TIGR02444 family)
MAAGGRGEGEAFWRFSLAFYARPGVAPALIALQDRDGLDVNVILYALWLGIARGHAMGAADLAAAEAAAAPLRDAVVVELRGLRRRLRAHPDQDVQALRRRVQALEIAAERAVQERLAGSLILGNAVPAKRRETALANLALCLGAASKSAEAETVRAALAGFSRRA